MKGDFIVRILLVMPGTGSDTDTPRRSLLPPGSLLEVAGMTNRDQHEVRIWDELAQGHVSSDLLDWAGVVGVSGLSTSHFGALKVARRTRDLRCKVVAGGMHVTGLCGEDGGSENKLLSYYDAIVVGRLTSRVWAEVLSDLSLSNSEGVYRASDDEPWEFTKPSYDLTVPRNYHLPCAVRTSAGCPYNCEFCTVNLVCSSYKCKSGGALADELALLSARRSFMGLEVPLIVYDDSFGVTIDHTINTALPVLKRCGRPWFTEITIRNLGGIGNGRESLIGKMAAAGCVGVYIGIEDPFCSDMSDKSLPNGVVEGVIGEAQGAGLAVMGSVMLDGTGEEDEDYVRAVVEWTIEVGLDLVQYSLVAALPGSETRRKALVDGTLICDNPSLYSGGFPTLSHPKLTPEQRINLLRYAYERTYSVRGIGRRIRGHKNPFLSLLANLVVRKFTNGWWDRFGYSYWLETHDRDCWS